jgi:hypothetical protein
MVDVVEMKGMEDGGGVEPHQPDAATGLVMPMGASEDAGGSSRVVRPSPIPRDTDTDTGTGTGAACGYHYGQDS